MKTLTTLGAAAMLLATSAHAATIDFDAASVTSQLNYVNLLASYMGTNYQEDGFLLQSSGPPLNALSVPSLTYNAGSYSMGATPLGTTTLSAIGNNPFSISSIDLLRVPGILNWSVTFTGTKADASVVTQSFTFTNNNWNTFHFNAGFTDLATLKWTEGAVRLYAYDNLVVSAVPEPQTYAMLIAGLGLAALARRRKQR